MTRFLVPSAVRRPAVAGMLLALGGSAVLSVNDMAVKALSDTYPLHQVVLVRSLLGLAMVATILAWTHGPRDALTSVRTRRPGLHLARIGCVVGSNLAYFLGLAALPLADGVAIFFVAPLVLTALSALLLGEHVGWRRWAAVATGFAGVLVMMRPSQEAAQGASLLVLAAAVLYALVHICTRRMRATESAITINIWTQTGFIAVSLVMAALVGDGRLADEANPSLVFLLRAWTWPAPGDWPLFLATGLAVTLGGLMTAQAYRLCEAALVAPFEYSAVPMAVLWGALVFGTWPDGLGWLGIGLICGAGLYALGREARHGSRQT